MAKLTSAQKRWLANDTTYQETANALKKALEDYKARMAMQKGQYNTEYNQNVGNLNTSRDAAITDQQNDFAGRGILRSGVYATSLADLRSDYNARQNALDTGKANYNADMRAALRDFQQEQTLAKQNAQRNALNRRLAQRGI